MFLLEPDLTLYFFITRGQDHHFFFPSSSVEAVDLVLDGLGRSTKTSNSALQKSELHWVVNEAGLTLLDEDVNEAVCACRYKTN